MLLALGGAAVLAWTWAGYPLLARELARLRPRALRPRAGRPPLVTVVVVARDEAPCLGAKLDSVRAGGVPAERLEIIVVDDASRDATSQVARVSGARAVTLAAPRGKAVALNSAVKRARGDVLVLTDARQPLEPGALARLLEPFADPEVGAVAGAIVGAADGPGAIYRRLDDALRRWEAAAASTVGVAGALWACRRALYPTLPPGLILDDLYAPLQVARTGARVVLAPDARVIERPEATAPTAERRRRVRTLAGNFELLARAPALLAPTYGLWWRFVSHKVLRLLGPLASVAVLGGAAGLAPRGGLYAAPALLATTGLALAVLGGRAGVAGRLARAFAEAQLLVVLAAAHALRGTTPWRPATDGLQAVVAGGAEVSHGL
jgi:hypothetical protein